MPQPKHIARILVPEIDHLDEETRKYFKICEDKLGMVPNVLRTYTVNMEKFRLFTAYYNNLMLNDNDCDLTILEREMIAVVVSSANRCYYCLVAHGQAVRQISGDPQLGEMLVMNYRVAELSPRTRAMLDFVWKLTKKPFDISEDDREEDHVSCEPQHFRNKVHKKRVLGFLRPGPVVASMLNSVEYVLARVRS